MRGITLTFIFVLCYIGVFSQHFYHTISKETFDSLNNNKYYGRLFMKNESFIDGWVKRTPTDEYLHFKADGKESYTIYNAFKVTGFHLINAKLDTAWYVFQKVKSERNKSRALRILIGGEENKIHLLRYAWLTYEESKVGGWFGSNAYEINWKYFIWKDGKLIELVFYRKHLKGNISDCPEALSYYKEYKRKLDGDGHFTHLQNIIRIYNKQSHVTKIN